MNSRTDKLNRHGYQPGFTLLRVSHEEIKPLLQHLAYSVYFYSHYPGYNMLHELLGMPPQSFGSKWKGGK